MEINICNAKGRDARVTVETVRTPLRVRWLDTQERQVANRKILRGTLDRDLEALERRFGSLEAVGQALVESDPEVDLESYGTFLEDDSRVFINGANEVVHKVVHWELVRSPDGELKERRPRKSVEPNVAGETPLMWSGHLMAKSEVYNRFVFSQQLQVVHHNGLTYDFLFGMAKELAEKESLLLLGGGAKSNQPLVFRRGGTPYRGFLEGRVEGELYALILHLSNMELKRPEPEDGSDEEGAES